MQDWRRHQFTAQPYRRQVRLVEEVFAPVHRHMRLPGCWYSSQNYEWPKICVTWARPPEQALVGAVEETSSSWMISEAAKAGAQSEHWESSFCAGYLAISVHFICPYCFVSRWSFSNQPRFLDREWCSIHDPKMVDEVAHFVPALRLCS